MSRQMLAVISCFCQSFRTRCRGLSPGRTDVLQKMFQKIEMLHKMTSFRIPVLFKECLVVVVGRASAHASAELHRTESPGGEVLAYDVHPTTAIAIIAFLAPIQPLVGWTKFDFLNFIQFVSSGRSLTKLARSNFVLHGPGPHHARGVRLSAAVPRHLFLVVGRSLLIRAPRTRSTHCRVFSLKRDEGRRTKFAICSKLQTSSYVVANFVPNPVLRM